MGWEHEAEFVVVGTGAAGATAGLELARARRDVLLLEEGGWYSRADYRPDFFSAAARLWRDFGGQIARGRAVFPVVQGCCVGGSTTVNAAGMHRLTHPVWERWAYDSGIRDHLPWEVLDAIAVEIEQDLQIRPNVAAGFEELPLAHALRRLGWAFAPLPRSAPGCQASQRCLQGCPTGGKWSMEATFIPSALEAGARVLARCRVERVLFEGSRAVGVEVSSSTAGERPRRLRIRGSRGVVVAAGAVHTPLVLRRSGLRGAHLGRHFQAHIGSNVVAEFARPANDIQGPFLACEVLHPTGLKFSSIQSVPLEILLGNVPAVGTSLAELLRRSARLALWNSSLPCTTEGTVGRALLGGAAIRLSPAPADYERIRSGVTHLARLFFEAGAVRVYPLVHGVPRVLTAAAEVDRVAAASLDPRNYTLNCSHLFGTCRMASRREDGVVDPAFRVHGTEGLWVIDASVFPSPTGTNPQQAVMTLARHAARGLAP